MDKNVFQSLADRVKTLLTLPILLNRLDEQPKKEVMKYFRLADSHSGRLDVRKEYLLVIMTLFVMKELTLDHQEDGFTASNLGNAWGQMIDLFPELSELFVYKGDEPSLNDLITRARYLIQRVFIDSSEHDHDALVFTKQLGITSENFSVLQRMNIYNEKQNEEHYRLSDSSFDFVLLTAEIFGEGLISIDTMRMNILMDKKEFDKLLEQLNHSRANLKHQVNNYIDSVLRLDPNDQSSRELAMRFKEKASTWNSDLNHAVNLVNSIGGSVDNSLDNMQSKRSLISHDPKNKEFQKLEKNIRLIKAIKLGLRELSNEMNDYRSRIIDTNDKLISLINQIPSFVSTGGLVKKLNQGPLKMQKKASDYLKCFDLLLPLFEKTEPRFTPQSLILPVDNPDFDYHLKLKDIPLFNSEEEIKKQVAEDDRQEQLSNQHQAESIRKMFTLDNDQFTFKDQLSRFSEADLEFVKQDPNQFFMDLYTVVSDGDVIVTKDKQGDRPHMILQKIYKDQLPVKLLVRRVGTIKIRAKQGIFVEPNIQIKVVKING